jgi:signal transduction histidine kinase
MAQPLHTLENNQLWMLIVNHPDGILVVDDQGYICFVNPAAVRLWSRSAESLEGQLFGYPLVDAGVTEVELILPKGQSCTAEMRVARFMWQDQEAQLVLLRDVTESKLLEVLLQDRTEALAGVTQDIELFSYTVSHSLWSFCRHIEREGKAGLEALQVRVGDRVGEARLGSGLAQIGDGTLAADYLSVTKAAEALKRISTTSQRMKWIIEDLLRLSRLRNRPFEREKVGLSELAQATLGWLGHSEPDRSVSATVHPNMKVWGDRALLEILLDNLIGNAWKYSSLRSMSRIEIGEVSVSNRKTWVKANGDLSIDNAIYFVRDNGVGFDLTDTEPLFRPFFRLPQHQGFEGNGVGLTIVQRIIQRHGGQIWFESKAKVGTTCYFTLAASVASI